MINSFDHIQFFSYIFFNISRYIAILLTKITAAQNEDAFGYHRVRGLDFLAVIFTATIVMFNPLTPIFYFLMDFLKTLYIYFCLQQ